MKETEDRNDGTAYQRYLDAQKEPEEEPEEAEHDTEETRLVRAWMRLHDSKMRRAEDEEDWSYIPCTDNERD